MVIYLDRSAHCLHMVQLMPLHPKTPHVNPDRFYLSGTSLPRLSCKIGRLVSVVVVRVCELIRLCLTKLCMQSVFMTM